MKKIPLLLCGALILCTLSFSAHTKYCVKLPTCEELGYVYSADKYPNNRSIKCPFDTKKILLLDYCQAYGLTSCDSTAGECDECIVEKADGTKSNSGYWRYTRCNAGYAYKSGECLPLEIDSSQYPIEGEENLDENIGEFECVESANSTYCGYTSCNEGWTLTNGNCIATNCEAFPYTECDVNGTCETCLTGTTTKYSAPVCKEGYFTSGGTCAENDCSLYTSISTSIIGCTSTSSCLSGTKTTYKCDTCYAGYDVVDGVCSQTCTYTATSLPSDCKTATGSCLLGSATGTTKYYATTCATCNDGWSPNRGQCEVNTCSGYSKTSDTIANCTTTASCQKGNTKVYKCATCDYDYTTDGNGGCKIACEYTITKALSGCQTIDSCTRGGETYYSGTCEVCYDGYRLDGSLCTKVCTLTNKELPTGCSATSYTCIRGSSSGNTTYYSDTCTSCSAGYEMLDGKCVKTCSVAGNCEVGDVYMLNSHPIGVVYANTAGVETKIIALTDIDKSGSPCSGCIMHWTNSSDYGEITGTTNSSEITTAINDINGKYNTNKILSYISANSKTTEAVTATSLYAPSVCGSSTICAKGNWYLPAAGELYLIHTRWSNGKIYQGLSSSGGNQFSTYFHWSSTEHSAYYAWIKDFTDGGMGKHDKASTSVVRPALQICAEGYVNANGTCVLACTTPGACQIGDVYAYNNAPIGVVFANTTGKETKLTALTDIDKTGASGSERMYWANSSDYNWSTGATQTTDEYEALDDENGKNNTYQILSYISANGKTVEAATATSLYAPSVCGTGSMCAKDKWYLPSLGELHTIFQNWKSAGKIYQGLSSGGGTQISTDDNYWSSTEYNSAFTWSVDFGNGGRWTAGKFGDSYVRPALHLCAEGYANVNGTCIKACDTPGACEVGDVYAYNNTPIGVVFSNTTALETKIAALTDIDTTGASGSEKMAWANSSDYDWLTGAKIINLAENALDDKNGKYNTNQILSYISANSKTAEAATATSLYAPSACGTGSMCAKGNWYLPSTGELYTLYSNKSTLNSKFTSNSGTAFKEDYYWASTEGNSANAWFVHFGIGGKGTRSKYYSYYVRPALQLCAEGYYNKDGVCTQPCTTPGACEIGDVYAYNGAPIGVVYANTTGLETKITALTDIDKSGAPATAILMHWANSTDYNWLTGATQTEDQETANNDMNGKYNTEQILAYIKANNKTAEATTATNLYTPLACPRGSICAQGNWYLPALGELITLFSNNTTLNTALASTEGIPFDPSTYWSSTETSSTDAWAVHLSLGLNDNNDKINLRFVRPSLQLCADGHANISGTCVKACTTPGACQVGDVYAYNGAPIGVVYANDSGNYTKLTALNNIDSTGTPSTTTSMYWSTSSSDAYGYSTGATITTEVGTAFSDMNGKFNTTQILNYVSSNSKIAEAATATSLYTPSSCPTGSICSKGNWYLPSTGELWTLYSNKSTLNSSFSKAGGSTFTEDFQWSSTEYDDLRAWCVNFSTGGRYYRSKYLTQYTRPSLQVCADGKYLTADGNCTTYSEDILPENCAQATASQIVDNTISFSPLCAVCKDGYKLTNGACGKYSVGDVYTYNDTPIGVVYYVDNYVTKIVALTDIDTTGASGSSKMYWAKLSDYNWSTGATQTTGTTTAFNDMNGKNNTDKILAYIKANSKTAEAATATSLYAPSACGTGSMCAKGNWYLPSAGELWTLYNNKATLNSKFTSNSGAAFQENYYWSSTEYPSTGAWNLDFSSGHRVAHGKDWTRYVRPVLQIITNNGLNEDDKEDNNGASQTCALTSPNPPTGCATTTSHCVRDGSLYYSDTCEACHDGYSSDNNGGCKTGCEYTLIAPIDGCKTTDSCTRIGVSYYSGTCQACYDGYELADALCTQICTLTNAELPANCATAADSCVRGSVDGNTTYYSDTCETCQSGFEKIDGNCVKTCSVAGACEIGDVYTHNDTPIGVVFANESGTGTKLIALTDVDTTGAPGSETMRWSTTLDGDYSYATGATITTDENTALLDMNGKFNTNKILSYISANNKIAEAATATSLYAPTACETGSTCAKGNWYLTSAGELQTLYDNKSTLNNSFSNIGGSTFAESSYWSSTERSEETIWRTKFTNGETLYNYKHDPYYVRPALQICAEGYINANGTCIQPCTTPGACQVGDVYAYNNTPIGVVFANESGTTTKIIALTDIKKDGTSGSEKMAWANSSDRSWSTGATQTAQQTTALADMNGKYNTNQILSYISANNKIAEAATASNLYAPSICETGSFCAKGNWYLPAEGELWIIYENWANTGKIYNSITSAEGYQFDITTSQSYYWSSTEYDIQGAWDVTFQNSIRQGHYKSVTGYVRPALQICAEGYYNKNGVCTPPCTTPGACEVGDVYAYNGTPIGVVFANETDAGTKIIALTEIDKTGAPNKARMTWGKETDYNWSTGATKTENQSSAFNDINGRYNTDKILSYISANNKTAEAATATNLYAPSACGSNSICSNGNWYLPSAGELYSVYTNWANRGNIYQGLSSGGGTQFDTDGHYWLSTERNDADAWVLNFNGEKNTSYKGNIWLYVRPALQLCAEGYENIGGTCIKACTTPGACEIGDIYAYNGTPIGVVFANEDGVSSKLVALTDIDTTGASGSSTMYWANSLDYIWSTGATKSSDETTAFNDMNGKYNTSKILSYISANSKTAEAATATSKYAPSVCETGSICAKGNWYLPAAGELWTLYNNKATLNSAFTSNGGRAFQEEYYWSSTESNATYAWYMTFSTGSRGNPRKSNSYYVRPVLSF